MGWCVASQDVNDALSGSFRHTCDRFERECAAVRCSNKVLQVGETAGVGRLLFKYIERGTSQ